MTVRELIEKLEQFPENCVVLIDADEETRRCHDGFPYTEAVRVLKGFNELDGLLKTLLPYIVTDMPSGEIKGHMYEIMDYIKYDLSDTRVPCAGSWEYYKTERGAEVLNINIPANAAYVKAKIYG